MWGGWWERLLPSSHLYPGCGCDNCFIFLRTIFYSFFFFSFTCNVFSPSISQGLKTWCTQNIQEVNYGSAVVQKWQLLPWRLSQSPDLTSACAKTTSRAASGGLIWGKHLFPAWGPLKAIREGRNRAPWLGSDFKAFQTFTEMQQTPPPPTPGAAQGSLQANRVGYSSLSEGPEELAVSCFFLPLRDSLPMTPG